MTYLVVSIDMVDRDIAELEEKTYSVDQDDGRVWLDNTICSPQRTAKAEKREGGGERGMS